MCKLTVTIKHNLNFTKIDKIDKTIMKKDGKNVSQYNTGSSNYPVE